MYSIVSVDLAYRTYTDTGIAVLTDSSHELKCAFVSPSEAGLTGEPDPVLLADFLLEFCQELGAEILLLDGPQAWKDPGNGLVHSRTCERVLGTPAKTGTPGIVKPGNYRDFVVFSIAVFDALSERGWSRYGWRGSTALERVAVESFPMSAWKSLGLSILPAKAKCRDDQVTRGVDALGSLLPMRLAQVPNHDEVQAMVAGLAGLGLLGSPLVSAVASGVAPFVLEGTWREGFIVNPRLPPAGPGRI